MLLPHLILEHNPFLERQIPSNLEHKDQHRSRQQVIMLRILGAQALEWVGLLRIQSGMLLKSRLQCFVHWILLLKRVYLEHNHEAESQKSAI